MFHLRAYLSTEQVDAVTEALRARDGVRHVVLSGVTTDAGAALVTAEVDDDVADEAIGELSDLGVLAADLSISRVEVVRPPTEEGIALETHHTRQDVLVWAEVTDEAVDNIGLRRSHLVYMAVGGILATFSVLDHNPILMVGAMAVSPDLLPLTAAAVAIVGRRPGLFGRAIGTLLPGLAMSVVTALLVTLCLRGFGVVAADADIETGVVYFLAHVNPATVCVALAAGVAGMLSFEGRGSFAVGVAISVTTMPAAAYMGVAAALGQWDGAAGALIVLGINLVMLLLAATVTLVVQSRIYGGPGQ